MIDYKTFFLISHNTDVDLRSPPTWDIHRKNHSEATPWSSTWMKTVAVMGWLPIALSWWCLTCWASELFPRCAARWIMLRQLSLDLHRAIINDRKVFMDSCASILYWKIQHFAPPLSFKNSPRAASATISHPWTSPSAAPATKSDTWTSPSAAPATKSDTWTSPSAAPAPARKSDTWTSPRAAPATKSDTWTSPNAAPATHKDSHA